MYQSFDVAIAGLGAMGSAAAYHLSRRGLSVIGFDRFTPPHTLGSSHGETRIIREAYFEHPSYVPLVQRAYELWEQLEIYSDRKLMTRTGGLMIGSPDGVLVTGSEFSARRHSLPYERLSPEDAHRRFPQFHIPNDMIAIRDYRAGILYPEACIYEHLHASQKSGAALNFNEPITSWESDGAGVSISTANGTYSASRLLVSAGAWTSELLKDFTLPLIVERQVLFWFQPENNSKLFDPQECPIFLWEPEPDTIFYGFPDIGNGIKVARMYYGEATTPDTVRRVVDEADEEPVREFLSHYIPNANGSIRASEVCMFTNTPDLNFIMDFHPYYPQVLIASPCSGHGFKFASAIGEIIADLLTEGESQYDLSRFKIDRFPS